MKAVTKMTNCTCRAKKVEVHYKNFPAYAPDFQIRSGATVSA